MKDPLVRFGVAIEQSLLKALDALTRERGCTRSELFRDLARAEVGRAKVDKGVDAVAAFTLVYDHHVRDLSERLTEMQHQLGDGVRATMHVHLNHDLCLEVIVLKGRSELLQTIADKILAMRGVKQGGIEIIADLPAATAAHGHAHGTEHGHHPHEHPHDHAHTHDAGYDPLNLQSAAWTKPGQRPTVAKGRAGRRRSPKRPAK